MAIASYSDVANFISGQGITLRSAAGTAFVQARISAAEAFLNRQTGRTYGDAAETKTRKFDGSGTPSLNIDPCLAVTQVRSMSLGTTVYTYLSTDWALYPPNSLPKLELRRVSDAGGTIRDYLTAFATPDHIYVWPRGQQNIEVDGTWGDASSAPLDYKEAVIVLAALWVLAGDALPTIGGTVAAAIRRYSTGVYSAEFANEAKEIIATVTQWGEFVEQAVQAHKMKRPW